MAELDRTFTEELFTEVLESTPCIIVYSQQAFECSKPLSVARIILNLQLRQQKKFSNLFLVSINAKLFIKERPRKTFENINLLSKN